MTAHLTTMETPAADPPPAVDHFTLVERALSQGSVEMVEKAMDLAERADRRRAERAFIGAKSASMGEIQPIEKDRSVRSGNGRGGYSFESLGAIYRAIRPALARHGLDYDFEPVQDAGRLILTIIVSHRDGHQVRRTFGAKVQGAPGSSEAQQLGGTSVILQRHLLRVAFGLAIEEAPDEVSYGISEHAGADPKVAGEVERILTAIATAGDKGALDAIARELGGGTLPADALPRLRAAYAARLRDLRTTQPQEPADA